MLGDNANHNGENFTVQPAQKFLAVADPKIFEWIDHLKLRPIYQISRGDRGIRFVFYCAHSSTPLPRDRASGKSMHARAHRDSLIMMQGEAEHQFLTESVSFFKEEQDDL